MDLDLIPFVDKTEMLRQKPANLLARGHDPVWAFARRRATFLAAGLGAALVGVWVLRAFVVPEWSPDPVGPPVWSASAGR